MTEIHIALKFMRTYITVTMIEEGFKEKVVRVIRIDI